MIKRMISIILLLTSTTAFAADQSATIPNSRLLNEDPASARQKVNAYSLGKMEGDASLPSDVMRVAILEDLIVSQDKVITAPLAVKENYKSILAKAILWRDRAPRNQTQLWDEVIQFLKEADSPAEWNPADKEEALRLSRLSTVALQSEFETNYPLKNIETGPYSLLKIDWELFRMDFVNLFIGILTIRIMLQRYEEIAKEKNILPESFAGFSDSKQDLSKRLKSRLVLREWVYRHWDGSVRPRSVRAAKIDALPIVAGSLGAASDRIVKPIIIEEYYKSIYEKVRAHLADTPQRAEVQGAWAFAKKFLEEAQNPSAWLANESPAEAADTKRFARMTTRELEAEFYQYERFSYYELRTIKWEIFRADTIGNFMNGVLVSRQMLLEDDFTPEEREIFSQRLTAARIFREWVYRHWDSSRRPASYRLFTSGSSLGTVVPSQLEKYYEDLMIDVEARIERARKEVETTRQDYVVAQRLLEKKSPFVSKDQVDLKGFSVKGAEHRLEMWESAPKFFQKAVKPSVWMEQENDAEREETKRFSFMTNDQLEKEIEKFHQFPRYSLRTITGKMLVGDAYLYLVYYVSEARKNCEQEGKDPYSDQEYKKKMSAQRIFREWIYRHWNAQPKPASYTFFAEEFRPVVHASSLGKQALVFQLSSGLNKEILDKTAELMRANPDRSVIFVVSRRRDGSAVSEELKARGLNVKDAPFEVNPLRTPGDSERFTKYIQGLQAKFPDKNGIAVIADFDVLSGLSSKNIISIARDKAGKGSDQAPASIANIQNIEREGTDSVLFNLAWNILSSSGPEKFLDQIERDASTGVFFIRLDSLKSLLEHWLSEHKTAQALLTAA